MMKKKNNPYGYKVCYKEANAKKYVRHFITYTLKQAIKAKQSYVRYPPRSRIDNHTLNRAKWVIIPIRHSEVKDGIWHEVPFWKKGAFLDFEENKYLHYKEETEYET